MTISVVRAFFHSGFLKAGTPLEMASTPVIAAPPDAKAWSRRKMPHRARQPPIGTWSVGIGGVGEAVPVAERLYDPHDRSSRTCSTMKK